MLLRQAHDVFHTSCISKVPSRLYFIAGLVLLVLLVFLSSAIYISIVCRVDQSHHRRFACRCEPSFAILHRKSGSMCLQEMLPKQFYRIREMWGMLSIDRLASIDEASDLINERSITMIDQMLKLLRLQGPMATPFYAIHATPIKTGTPEAYNPKGAWKNPQKRNWTKVQTWQPPTLAGKLPV